MPLNFNLSDEDRNSMGNRDNPEPYIDGFDEVNTGNEFSVFNDMSSNNSYGQGGIGGIGGMGGTINNVGSQIPINTIPGVNGMNLGGINPQPVQQQTAKPDLWDQFFQWFIDNCKAMLEIIKQTFGSIKLRTSDDIGSLAADYVKIGGIAAIIGLAAGLVGTFGSIPIISFSGISFHVLFAGIITALFGGILVSVAAFLLANKSETEDMYMVESLPEIQNSLANELEAKSGDFMSHQIADDVMSGFSDSSDDDFDFDFSEDEEGEDEFDIDLGGDDDSEDLNFSMEDDDLDFLKEEFDPKKALDSVSANSVMTRETLFNTFKTLLPKITPNFQTVEEIDRGSKEFEILRAKVLKAMANTLNTTIEGLDEGVDLISAKKTIFSYELMAKRVIAIKKAKMLDFEDELEIALRQSSDDLSTQATVTVESDCFKIIVALGTSKIVSFGDIFRHQENCDFFLDTKNQLPIISGIDALGNVMLEDAKKFDSIMITGKQNSGKSWYVAGLLMAMMMFNTPDTVQFIIIDPKISMFFNTLALMPHVAGLHDGKNILEVLDDIINVEAPRRKKILNDAKCEDIWDLRKKGIKLPVLYIMIDEYITIKSELEMKDKELAKEFQKKFLVILSQHRYLGIRLMFVPHRATGIVDKTSRTLIHYAASVMGNPDEVEETIGTKWTKPLVKPGDIAYKASTRQNAIYVRGAVLTDDNGKNVEFITMAAQAFYKMGVDMPDMSSMRVACNRDEKKIREKLTSGGNRFQYTANNVFDDLDTIKLDSSIGSDDMDLDIDEDIGSSDIDEDIDLEEEFETNWDEFDNT